MHAGTWEFEVSPKSGYDYESSYPSNLNTGYVLLLSSGMGTLVGMFEGSRQVGLMLALLPWHWLIQDILACQRETLYQ
ncbi:hypothetical protein KY290_031151 [Solanum tuberosum]|uniref:Uncharacterized protein n=1 Tax=Solanum tuberosum TaxID=4113 RepID=A0ABQ7U8M1_SOLTU|nr:hypothetical protein KY290_031151 [Solanum tuberosum]